MARKSKLDTALEAETAHTARERAMKRADEWIEHFAQESGATASEEDAVRLATEYVNRRKRAPGVPLNAERSCDEEKRHATRPRAAPRTMNKLKLALIIILGPIVLYAVTPALVAVAKFAFEDEATMRARWKARDARLPGNPQEVAAMEARKDAQAAIEARKEREVREALEVWNIMVEREIAQARQKQQKREMREALEILKIMEAQQIRTSP